VEGETDDQAVLALRSRQQRNFLATLLLSQGVPMILHGDELGRTQGGNNNSYAQDSEISWVHWDQADQPLIEFTAAVSRLRKDHPIFRRARFFDGRPAPREEGAPKPDIQWLRPDGTEMQPEDWDSGFGRAVGVFLNGEGIRDRDLRGEPVTDVDFLLYFSAADEPVKFKLPAKSYGAAWDVVIDTAGKAADRAALRAGKQLVVEGRSLLVLQAHQKPDSEPDHSVAASLAVLANTPSNATVSAPTSGTPVAR
jgi:isoamylase